MKRKIVNLFQILAITAIAFASNSCSDLFNDPLKDKETNEDINLLLIDLNFFDTKVTLKFEDFDTGELLTGQNITASIVGNNADKFVNLFGEKKEEWQTSSGIMELYLDPSYTFTAEPLQLEVYAYSNPYYLSAPTSIEMSEAAERIIIVPMINWDTTKSATLKSASTEEKVVISVDYEDNNGRILKTNLDSNPRYGNIYRNFFSVDTYSYQIINNTNNTNNNAQITYLSNLCKMGRQSACQNLRYLLPATYPPITLTATAMTGIDSKLVSGFGFYDYSGMYESITLGLGGMMQATTGYYRNGLEKCPDGLTVKITCPDIPDDDLTSSGSFRYRLYLDGATLTGEISGTFYDLKTKGYKIEPIYYYNDPLAYFRYSSITLEENSQYKFETKTLNDIPCGEIAFVAKKKSDLTPYSFHVTYSCPSGSVGFIPSGTVLLKNITKGTAPETFNINSGSFTLNLIKGDKYEISPLVNNVPRTFILDTNNVNGLRGQSVEGNTITSVFYYFFPSPSDPSDGLHDIQIHATLTDDVCSHLK